MSDFTLDLRIRAAVLELLDAAPPPPPLPAVEMAPPLARPRRTRMAVALVSVAALIAGAAIVASNRVGDSGDERRVLTPAALVPASTVSCTAVIGTDDRVGAGRQVVLGRVALSTKGRALQANSSGDPNPAYRFFAKDGLLVKREVPVELIVPRLWRDKLSLEWGDSERTDHLKVSGCPASTPGERWLAFAGGYWVPRPVCAPLIVKVGTRTQRVKIGIGKACPGQQPAPPGN